MSIKIKNTRLFLILRQNYGLRCYDPPFSISRNPQAAQLFPNRTKSPQLVTFRGREHTGATQSFSL